MMFLHKATLAAGLVVASILAGCAAGQSTPAPGAGSTSVPTTAVAEGATAAAMPASRTAAQPIEGGTAAVPTAPPTNEPAPGSSATPLPTSRSPAGDAAQPTASSRPASPTAGTGQEQGTARVKGPPSPVELDGIRISLRPLVDGLKQPLFFTYARQGDSALELIVEKAGRIRLSVDGKLAEAPFLDITDRVGSSGSEQGLLGLAFPPNYDQTGYFFINYTDRNGDTVIARYSVTNDPRVADPNSETEVLKLDQPAANHNGGMLAFGPDGKLWIGTGDGGGAGDRFGNGQNPATLLGKMLRIDVTSDPSKPYTIPPDNPWVTKDWNGQKVRPEVWAVGLRNPWRYSFDRVTGDLWIADVGQNKIEEVDFVPGGGAGGEAAAPPPSGLNFGWPIMEGRECFQKSNCDPAGLVLPVAQYQHGADGCSITGGYVYRGSAFPQLQGVYLYSDFCSGRLWGLVPDGKGGWYSRLLLETGMSVSSFGEDAEGELVMTDLQGGSVQRIEVVQ